MSSTDALAQGGPDGAGYRWDPAAAAFEDISATGTDAAIVCDDCSVEAPIGFTFNWYGDDYTSAFLGSNGLLTFVNTSASDFSPDLAPDVAQPNALIAPFWADLDTRSGGTLHYATVGAGADARFIAQWTDVCHFSQNCAVRATFQVVLFPSGEAQINILDAQDDGSNVLIGFEGPGGTEGLTISFAAASVSNASYRVSVSPEADAGGPYTVDEGQTVALAASGVGLNLTYAWDLDGDGQFDDAVGPTPNITADNGPETRTITVQVTDSVGRTATDTAQLQINNVAPTVSSASAAPNPGDESAVLTFSAAATDPGTDTITYVWDFGDGSPAGSGANTTHAYADDGTYTVTLTASDGDGGQDQRVFNVNIDPVAPNVSAIAGDATRLEGQAGAWSATLSKAAQDTVDWTVTWGDGSAPLTGQLTPPATFDTLNLNHTYTQDGDYTITLTARDDDNQSDSAVFAVTVTNAPPQLVDLTITPPAPDEGQSVAFSASATDPGADVLTYTWDFGDGSPTVTGASANHTYTQDGTYTVALIVADDDTSIREERVVTVGGVVPQILSLIGDDTGVEGAPISMQGLADDPSGGAITYTWDWGDGSPQDSGVGLTDVSHTYTDDGAYTVTLTVSDDDGSSSTQRAVTIANANPSIATINTPALADEGQTASFSASATDPGADVLTYTWDFGDGSPTVTGPSADHTFADDGMYTVTLTVTDDDGGSASGTRTVTVNNLAPQLVALVGDFSGDEGDTFDFTATVTDPAGANDTLTQTWSWGDGSPNTVTNGSGDVAASHIYTASGTYTLRLTVSDEDGGSISTDRSVNVGGQAPSIVALGGDTEGDEGATFDFNATVTDPGGDPITYAWDWGDGSPITSGLGLADVSHVYADDGTYTVTLTASDPDGSVASSLTVTVANVAPALTVDALDQDTAEGQVVNGVASALDPAGANDPITYTWDWGDGSPLSTGASASHIYAEDGTYTVTLTASDDDGGQSVASRTVTVRNVAPQVAAINGPNAADEGAALDFSASASDPGVTDALTFRWSWGDGSPDATGPDLTDISHTYADDGAYTITLTVSDDDGASTSRTLEVVVSNLPPQLLDLSGPDAGDEQSLLAFSATATDPGDDLLTYAWDWGDGSPQESGIDLTNVSHTYAAPGSYTLRVTVDDGDGGVDSLVRVIEIGNVAPTITDLSGDTAGDEGDSFAFTAAAVDPGVATLRYTWDWGDGSPQESGLALTDVGHTYAESGVFTLTLTVSDGAATDTAQLEINVANVAPSVTAFNLPDTTNEGASISAEASATDPGASRDPITYVWDWGDGSPVSNGARAEHTYADDGVYTVTLTASDDDGASTTRTQTVTVANLDPNLTLFGGPDSVEEGASWTGFAIASDVPADPLNYAWTLQGGPSPQGPDVTEVTYAWPDSGQFDVQVVVSDDDGGQVSATRTIDVLNVAPSIVALVGDFVGNEGDTFAFSASATDPGADTLTYAWKFNDDSPDAELTGVDLTDVSHVYTVAGSYTLEVTVTDDDGASVTLTRTVSVGTGAPAITDLSGDTAGDEGAAFAFTAAAVDPTDQPLTYTWDWSDGSPQDSGVGLTEAAHVFADNGSYVVTLTVADPDGNTAQSTLRVTVANVAPTIDSFDIPDFAEGVTGTVFASASDPGGANDPLTYTWTWGDGSPQLVGFDITEAIHTYFASGVFTIVLTVTDDEGASAVATREVTVADAPPVVFDFDGPDTGQEGEALTFTLTAAEPGGSPLTYTWQIDDGDPIDTGDTPALTYVFEDDGTYVVRGTATDRDGQSASQERTVTIANVAPAVSPISGRLNLSEGETLSVFATATDPAGDNDPLTYTWDWGDGSPQDSGAQLTAPTHDYAEDGVYTVALTVSDGDGGETVVTASVAVVNVAPELVSFTGPITLTEGATASFQAVAVDAGDDPLTYTWDWGDGSAPVSDADGRAVHVWRDDGVFSVNLVVDDGDGGQVLRERPITITNVPPTITSDPPALALVGRPYTYAPAISDPGLDDVFTLTLDQGPEGMDVTPEGALAWVPAEGQLDGGPYDVAITVCDDDGGCAQQSWSIQTQFVDEDNDGMPDACEVAFGLDPDDPSDADQDNDGDAITNRDECLDGTDPTVFNGPTAPTLFAPEDGARVASAQPELRVVHATDPDDDPLTYTLEIYADADLTDLVVSIDGLEPEPDAEASAWEVPVALDEDQRYWWRARAADANVAGPWSAQTWAFLVDTANAPPSSPVALAPEGDADTATPEFSWDAAVDPEGDPLVYTLELYAADAIDAPLQTATIEPDPNNNDQTATTWTPEAPLDEDAAYTWRVSATDALGVSGPWSELLTFRINTANALPEAPEILAPEAGALIEAPPVEVIWIQAFDADQDPLTYDLDLAEDAAFTQTVESQRGLPMGVEPTVSVTLDNLSQRRDYWLRVRANDAEGAGPYAVVNFRIGPNNTAPSAPILVSPIDDANVTPGDIALVWDASDDPDNDTLTYTVAVYDTPEPVAPVWSEIIVNSSGSARLTATWPNPDLLRPFYWQVTATDPLGDQATSQLARFVVVAPPQNRPPTAPTALEPSGGVTIDAASFPLVAGNADDPDDDVLTYTFEIYADIGLTERVWSRDGVAEGPDGTTGVLVSDLDAEGDLYWRVFATDGQLQSPSSTVGAFKLPTEVVVTPPSGAAEGSGCGCRTLGPAERGLPSHTGGALALLLAGVVWGARRRRGR